MIFEHSSYRTYLRSTLVERIGKNSRYSLRAFAKTLQISPASLSEVISGKQNLSSDTAWKVAKNLDLDEREADYFYLLVQYEATKNPETKETLQSRLQAINPPQHIYDMDLDVFKMISDWYHIPILELSMLDDFKFSSASVAKALGISKIEADSAIERLLRLKLLDQDEWGEMRKTRRRISFSSDLPNQALRKFHGQMLAKAGESLITQSPQEKHICSETMPFDPQKLEEVKALTKEYTEKVLKLAGRGKKKTKVYHLGVQFFSLMDPAGEESK